MVGMKEDAVERADEERRDEEASCRSSESKRDSRPSAGVEVIVRLGGRWMLLCRSNEDCSASEKLFSHISVYLQSLPALAGVKTMTVSPTVVTKSRKPKTVSVT